MSSLDPLGDFCRQLRPWASPAPCLHNHKPTTAKARAILASGVPTVHSDVPQRLSLQSQWWRCKSRLTQLPSHAAPGAQLWFQLHFCSWAAHWHLLPGPTRWQLGLEASPRAWGGRDWGVEKGSTQVSCPFRCRKSPASVECVFRENGSLHRGF